MKTSTPSNWVERLQELHPLLKAAPRPASDWAARKAEMDAAMKADAEAARRTRDEIAPRKERGYDNHATTWAGLAAVVVIAALGLFITFRLIEESRLEDCLLAHRQNCDSLLDR